MADLVGVWFNKRALSSIEIPIKHEFKATDSGYSLNFLADGRVTVVTIDKGRQSFDLKAGDSLRSSGEEFFLALAQRSP